MTSVIGDVHPPKELNGYKVRRYSRKRGSLPTERIYVVWVDKPSGEIVICTWFPACGTEWIWGNYFRKEDPAQDLWRRSAEAGVVEVIRG